MIKSNVLQKTTERLSGSIERVTFHNEESGFCVLKVKVRGQRDLIAVIGSSVNVTPGEYVDCVGNWVTDKEYGLQFRATELKIVLPATLEGMEKYLGSGMVRGIGPHFAKRLVQAFGLQVFDIIEHDPERLKELPGIGPYRQAMVVKSWGDQKIIREIVVFLHAHGVGTARAVRIYKTYGKEAITKVRENPYRLALDIRGIGFKTADALAEKLGIPRESLIRAEAGVRHVLQELCQFGHCAVHSKELVEKSGELLALPEELILSALQHEIAKGHLIAEPINGVDSVFLAALYRAEVGVVEHIKRLLKKNTGVRLPIEIEKALDWVEQKTGLKLSKTQREALEVVLKNKVVIITGGPGVGKTTLVNSILKIICQKTKYVALGAPTGRAAKRLSDSTGLEAKTLHRLLEYDPQQSAFRRNESCPIEAEFMVVDEMSMVDLPMMYQFLKAVPDVCALLLVGDVDQLPSVGPGAILANLIESQKIPTVRLTEIFRQAKTSQIIMNAHRINQGSFPYYQKDPLVLSDFYFIEAETPELIYERLLQVVVDRIPKRFGFNPTRDVQVLVPMNRGGLGTRALNLELQKRLNPNRETHLSRYGLTFSVGDKVIQTVNNYDKEIFNGDIGFVSEIDEEAGTLGILFEGRVVSYEADELDELSLAYATTIHKAQGSEYPAVVIPLSTQHYTLLERNLVYTGVTRAKSLVVIIGQKKALSMAIRTIRSTKRVTNLTYRLLQIE